MNKPYLIVGWNSRYIEPGFQSSHASLEEALKVGASLLTENHDQVSFEIHHSTKLLIGEKRGWQRNGVMMTPENFDASTEAREAKRRAERPLTQRAK